MSLFGRIKTWLNMNKEVVPPVEVEAPYKVEPKVKPIAAKKVQALGKRITSGVAPKARLPAENTKKTVSQSSKAGARGTPITKKVAAKTGNTRGRVSK
jgi:hypothetical protein